MRIFVGMPAYDGKICAGTVKSLLDEQRFCAENGDYLEAHILSGHSLITYARNELAQKFMESDFDRIVFVDADIEWTVGAVRKLARIKVDFVGAAYRFKHDEEAYPVGWLKNTRELQPSELGLIEVHSLATGFLSLSRDVFYKLKCAFPEEKYTHRQIANHAWFQAPLMDGKLYGEDTFFSHKWQSIGGKIWLDPTLKLTHIGGSSRYTGCILDWLNRVKN